MSSCYGAPTIALVSKLRAILAGGGGFLMRVLFVSAEIFPLAKTGGLADVSAALPKALAALGVDVRLVMPGYPGALSAAADKTLQSELRNFGGQDLTRVISANLPDTGLPVWLVDCPALFDREGGPYQDAQGCDWPDNAERFAHLSRVAARIASGAIDRQWRADVVHCNDWHAGLLPLLLRNGGARKIPTLFTIHNLAFQGLFAARALSSLGLSEDLFTPDGIEFHGRISFMKTGIRFGDRLTTVSPSYAREIMTPEYGCGLDGILRSRASDLDGIVNGVDCDIWNPETDPHLPANFSSNDMAGKDRCKAELQGELGLDAAPHTPLMIWASRLTHQKMADAVLEAMPAILDRGVQFALIGQGDESTEREFAAHAASRSGRMAVHIGYQEPLAHRLYAAGDLLLHPSRFEPCGLTPLYAMRYGTLPIVRSVGGLSDTVVDADDKGPANGFSFRQPSVSALLRCVDRALGAHAKTAVGRKIRQRAMTRDSSWRSSAAQYLAIYRELAPKARDAGAIEMPAPAIAA
jgi:starch synthase